jgi:oligopeptide transport system permease protein
MVHLMAWRLVQLPLILLVVFLGTFSLVWMIPGSPLDQEDRQVDEKIRQAKLRQYHLHDPWSFLSNYAKNLLRGDLGPSLKHRDQRVNDILGAGLPVSVSLGFLGLGLALLIGLGAGLIGAAWPGSWLDQGSLIVSLLGISLPSFVTGTLLLVVFAGGLGWFDIGRWGRAQDMVLPALALSAAPAAYIARLTRLGMADVMSSDYVRTARAKGVAERWVLFKHALKVAFLPVLSFLGPAAATTLTGSFVVEQIFNVPGLGEHFVNAARSKDYYVILGVVLVYATMLIVFNLIVDLAYAWLDPRIDLSNA